MKHRWQVCLFLVMFAVVCVWGGGSAHAFSLRTKVSYKRFETLIKTLKTWTLDCKLFTGTLETNTTLAGLPAKAGTPVVLYVTRHLAYALSGKCHTKPLQCKQCDTCSQACIQGKPWSLKIETVKVKSLVLAYAHSVQGFPFKAGTKLVFRKSGVLASATLESPQTLMPRRLKKQVKLSRGANITFIPAPNPKVWSMPQIEIFYIGNFRCYYTGKQLAMVCTF